MALNSATIKSIQDIMRKDAGVDVWFKSPPVQDSKVR